MEATGEEVSVDVGKTGQFDVVVDGQVVAQRTGGFFTKAFLNGGWPTSEDVVAERRS